MNNSRWATVEEYQKTLKEVGLNSNITTSGIPFMYDDNHLYIDDNLRHNLIIGSTGSGKTQAFILPTLKLAIKAQESFLINDVNGDIYQRLAKKLKQENYKVIAIDMDNPTLGDSWNPLSLPYKLYKEKNFDKSLEILEEIGYYLFYEKTINVDPFWINSTINYFTGLVLYLFENAKEEEISLSSVGYLANELNQKGESEKFLEKIEKNSVTAIKLNGTLKAPSETRGSILSVFNQKIEKYLSRKNLENMLSNTNYDFTKVMEEKTAIFLISGIASHSSNLVPLFVEQIIDTISIYGSKERRFNMIIDSFDNLIPIKDFSKKLSYSRSLNIRITVTIESYIQLLNMYSKEEVEILKMCFGNIIYLLSQDIYTMEEISKNCGTHMVNDKEEPLITISELKTMNSFEAVVLTTRMLPFKTTLLPDYKIDWGYVLEEEQLEPRVINTINVFELHK